MTNNDLIRNALDEIATAIPEFRQGMNREEEIIGSIMSIILAAKNIARENGISLPENI